MPNAAPVTVFQAKLFQIEVQFELQLCTLFAQLLGVTLHQTMAYHPESNSLIKRFHRQLNASLAARLDGLNWADQLLWVMLGIQALNKNELGALPAKLVHGGPLTLLGQFHKLSKEPFFSRRQIGGVQPKTDTNLGTQPSSLRIHPGELTHLPFHAGEMGWAQGARACRESKSMICDSNLIAIFLEKQREKVDSNLFFK